MTFIIGITCSRSVSVASPSVGRMYEDNILHLDYAWAIEQAGGLPIAIPTLGNTTHADEYLGCIHGLLLAGGLDVDPLLYGEEPHPRLGAVDLQRDELEIALTQAALDKGIPILAICRGIQVLNIAAGGDLYQDISECGPNLLKHMQDSPKWHGSHTVQVKPGTLLWRIVQKAEWRVNSFHHQSVKRIAPGFVASASAQDGVIEAIESTEHPFALGLQSHPEMMWQRDPLAAKLFQSLIQACNASYI